MARGQDEVKVKDMIDLVLVKRDIMHYVQDLVKGMGQCLSGHHVVLCKVRLVGAWIKRREVVDGARRFKNEKLWEHQFRKGIYMLGLLKGRE